MARPKKGETRTSPTVSFKLTIDRELADALDKMAKAELRSRTNQIVWILQNEVRKRNGPGEKR